jgi:hypothetical protein
MIFGFDHPSAEQYQPRDDGLSMIIQSIGFSAFDEDLHTDHELEKLIDLRHPCISSPIGFVFGDSRGLKIIEFNCEVGSSSDLESPNPCWWTATAKTKAILGLRFAHSLGLIHGHLDAKTSFSSRIS